MNKNLKIGIVLLLVASVLFLCSTVAFFIMKESEKEKRIYLEKDLEELMIAKDAIASDLEEIKITKNKLEIQLSSAKEEAERVARDLAREKEAKGLIESQLDQEKRRSDELMADVMKEKEERLSLVHRLSGAEEAYRDLKGQFDIMVEAKETLEHKLKDMMAKRGVELQRIEVSAEYQRDEEVPAQELASTAPVSIGMKNGEVLVVNRKFNFVVANVGESDGLSIDTALDIYRDKKLIARTKVEKLYDKMSAATILPEYKSSSIKEGDQVYISR